MCHMCSLVLCLQLSITGSVSGNFNSRNLKSSITELNLPWPSDQPEKIPRVISWQELQNQLRVPYSASLHKLQVAAKVNPFVEVASARQINDRPTATPSPPPPVLPPPPSWADVPTYSSDNHYHLHVHPYHEIGKPCIVSLEGKRVSCFEHTHLYSAKLEELRATPSQGSFLLSDPAYNSCHEVSRKRRAIYFPSKKLYFKNIQDNFGQGTNKSRANDRQPYPSEVSSPRSDATVDKKVLRHPSEIALTGPCVAASYTLLRPYYLYNVFEELRFIVQQDDAMEQCQPKAVCR